MQLDAAGRPGSVRGRIGAAVCVLLASGAPALARGEAGATTQLDASALIYGERNRANVVEPVARVTRLFGNGQTLAAQLGIDVMTGASPSGAQPSNTVQTTTTASGSVVTSRVGVVPTRPFKDLRGSLDLDWGVPLGSLVNAGFGTHVSREKDYQSLGASGKLTVDLMHRLATLTLGGGADRDGVFPLGGTPVGLSDGSALLTTGTNPKRVATGLLGISRILTRRWMMGLNLSRTTERGYLTEPYKVLSLVDALGSETGQVTEKRPSSRDRRDVMASSVYHLTNDVVYASYRYYWDDWGVRSHTVDLKYRYELPDRAFAQPHLRFYAQTPADFYRFSLPRGSPLPDYASSDFRLGALRSVTIGATYGFRVPGLPGELTVRPEYIRQFGNGHPRSAIGAQRDIDLFPALDIGSLVIGYSREF
jgi:hypothetical protein